MRERSIICRGTGLLSVILSCAFLFGAPLSSPRADERPDGGRTDAAHEGRQLESIADEVEEVAETGTEEDGMARAVDEMNAAEDEDGCVGNLEGDEGAGC